MNDEGLSKNQPPPHRKNLALNEKRYLPRWNVNNRVLYLKEEGLAYQECRSRDINAEGACICPSEALAVNQPLKLTFYLSEGIAVYAQGKVKWVKNQADQKIVGLQFDNVSEKTQDMILQYAFNFNKAALTKHWFQGW